MVLDNASNAGDDFNDQPPSSDGDPYSSSITSLESKMNIDLSKLPKPIPIIGPLLGIDSRTSTKLIMMRVEAMAKVMERPLTQDEATAAAFWTMKQVSVASYGMPLGFGAGAWRTAATASTYKFPFWQPDLTTFRPDVWPNARLAIISGPLASSAWHSSRLMAYGAIGGFVGSLIFGSYAATITAVGELSDPRLKEFVQAIREKAQNSKGRVPNQPRQPGMVGVRQKADPSFPKGMDGSAEDDGSPTSGTYGDTDDSADASFREGGPIPSQDPRIVQQPHQIGFRRPIPGNSNHTSDQEDKSSDSFGDAFGDASPTGGKGVLGDTEPVGGSAWARIRQQASSSPANKTQGSSWPTGQEQQPASARQSAWSRRAAAQQDGEPSSESFTYSKLDEEKQLARDEAQREFDDRVERERRGGDFNSESGNSKRW